MIKLMLFIMVIVGLAGCMLIVLRLRHDLAQKMLYVSGLGCVVLSWLLLILNFTTFVKGWHQYVPHEIVMQAPSSSLSLRILAPLFSGIFSIGPAAFMGSVLSLASIAVGAICLIRQPNKQLLPFTIALINVLFLIFIDNSLGQLITYLPYTMDRVVGTLILLLGYSAALCIQSGATIFPTTAFGWMENEDDEMYQFYEHQRPRSMPMRPARMVSIQSDR